MKTIKVTSLIGSGSLLAPEKGTQLYEEIRNAIKQHGQVCVDFSGYEYISSTFLNHSFGQICIDFCLDEKKFPERIEIVGLDEDERGDLDLTIYNASMRRKLMDKKIDVENYYATRLSM